MCASIKLHEGALGVTVQRLLPQDPGLEIPNLKIKKQSLYLVRLVFQSQRERSTHGTIWMVSSPLSAIQLPVQIGQN